MITRQVAAARDELEARVLAEMFRLLPRWKDTELPVPAEEVGTLREFLADWAEELEAPGE